MRWTAGLLVAAVLAGCQGQAAAPPSPRPTPAPTAVLTLATPAQAILADAEVGLPKTGGTDSLTAAELAAEAPDEVVALARFNSWGWVAGAQRRWSGGGRTVDALVVLNARGDGAGRAYADLAADAGVAPLTAGPCPAAVAGLDECVEGTAPGRQVFAGRLDAEVFELTATGLDATALAARQAERLHTR